MSVTELHPITLGGSDVPAVLGLDPFCSAYALGCRKLGLTSEPPTSEAMQNGLDLEAAHVALVEGAGYEVESTSGNGRTHNELSWLVVHPDAYVLLDGYYCPLELKARGREPSDAILTRDTLQTFTYLNVLGAPRGMISTLHGGYGGIQRREDFVEADAELWAMIVEACERFLDTLRRGKLPAPDGTDSTREALRARFAHAEPGKTIRLTAEQWTHVKRLRELDEVIATAKAQRERHAQVIQEAMGDATEAVSPLDTLAVRWKPITSTRTDTKALAKAHPAIAAEFATRTTYRKFEANP